MGPKAGNVAYHSPSSLFATFLSKFNNRFYFYVVAQQNLIFGTFLVFNRLNRCNFALITYLESLDNYDLGDWIGIVWIGDHDKATPNPIVYLGDWKPEMLP